MYSILNVLLHEHMAVTVFCSGFPVNLDVTRFAVFGINTIFCLPDCFSGDEGGESELLGEALQLEPSVAKAERSHLIVWQVMCGSEWACRMQLETLKKKKKKKTGKKKLLHVFFILWNLFHYMMLKHFFALNFILQICHTFNYTGISLCCFTAPVLHGTV